MVILLPLNLPLAGARMQRWFVCEGFLCLVFREDRYKRLLIGQFEVILRNTIEQLLLKVDNNFRTMPCKGYPLLSIYITGINLAGSPSGADHVGYSRLGNTMPVVQSDSAEHLKFTRVIG